MAIRLNRRSNVVKSSGSFYLPGFALLIPLIGMACVTLMGGDSPATLQPPGNAANGLATFTDQNKLYQIDVPADWDYVQMVDGEDNYYYIDRFTSPDGKALIENIAYDDGRVFKGSQLSKFALRLLNTFYSNTGQVGDIRISGDSVMNDGRERLTWTSKSGDYSGLSFLDTRGESTFLLLTVKWDNETEVTYGDLLSNVVASYRIP
jgi:hypothetical protein